MSQANQPAMRPAAPSSARAIIFRIQMQDRTPVTICEPAPPPPPASRRAGGRSFSAVARIDVAQRALR